MGEKWEELSSEEKSEEVFKSWLSPKGVKFVSPEAEKSYKERATRIKDAIQLKVPDSVPFWFQDSSFFPAKYTGITCEEAMYDADKWFAANKKTFLDFEPDMYFNPGASLHAPGGAYEALDCKQYKWPGHGVSPHHTFQFVEGEYMKADEYDAFINDLSDYSVRTYLPRVYGTLEPLKMLPPLNLLGLALPGASSILAIPEVTNAFKSLYQAGLESMKWVAAADAFKKEMAELGFPVLCGGAGLTPFDLISDMFRGMRGTMLDMYRQPDKLLEATEKVLPMLTRTSVSGAKMSGTPGVFIALHRGADGFMSLKQFETFYWPGLKKLMLALIDEGLVPCPFFEGHYEQRLEYLTELPKGKVLGLFDSTDMLKAKESLGDTMCISGMMPLSLLQTGTPQQVKDHAKKLIDVVGKGGGFIMGPRSAMDEAKPELVKVWTDFTKEYGVYR